MIKYVYLLCSFYLLTLLAGCSSKSGEGEEELPYNPFVEAFTSGKISRYTPVYLLFNQEIPADKLKQEELKKLIKIKPEVAGEFAFENNRTLVFKPAKGFERNTTYKVKADLSDWFDAEGKDETFAFSFSTLPLAVRANLQSIDINKKNENGYDILFSLFTPDKETPETVEALIRFSEQADVAWQHSPDGKKHQATLTNVQSGTNGTRALAVSVGPNKSGVPEEELVSVDIPDMNDFSIYDAQYVAEPERFVEVTFTKLLDAAQNMEGLAYIAGNKSQLVNVEGNKLRL